MIRAQLLERKVLASLRPRVGEALRSVTYRCIEHEAELSDLNDPEFYMGGEVELGFERAPLFISWDENAGWDTHFSVQTSQKSLFLPEARLQCFDGAAVALWRPHIESKLVDYRVLGWDGVPYAVLLGFGSGALVVGASSQRRLGDGDDLIVRDASHLNRQPPLDVLWDSRPTP